jgi:hypothetical protein
MDPEHDDEPLAAAAGILNGLCVSVVVLLLLYVLAHVVVACARGVI